MASSEKSSCGVGFVVSLKNISEHANLERGLQALVQLEHRGGLAADLETSDGVGIMTDIPYELLGLEPGSAVANLFLPADPTIRIRALHIFEETFKHLGLRVSGFREVPTNPEVLSPACKKNRPQVLLAFIQRPEQCTTRYAFEKLLYSAKQATRSRLREGGVGQQLFFTSLSAGTIVYKALTRSKLLSEYYLDLKNPKYKTRFSLFHRRFSTNTSSSWDKAQPFRMVAHNGEINTISGNRAWAYARERALGIREDELLTHRGISDSGSVNEMIEALMFRSSIPHAEDILAIMMPQADVSQPFYKFWSRAMEPWDGPALFTFSDARTIGARLDRSGFRPCRWARTDDRFYLSSEAGSFDIPEHEIRAKGSLSGGASVSVDIQSGVCHFKDASECRENRLATFDAGLSKIHRLEGMELLEPQIHKLGLFRFTEEEIKKIILPTVRDAREPIGSMGDTARVAVLSHETRSLFDYFYQNFAQVTNPPLDYLREKMVTDMRVVLGRKPNIFEPKEMIPAKRGLELEGPVLSLGQMQLLHSFASEDSETLVGVGAEVFDATFAREGGLAAFNARLDEIKIQARKAILAKKSIFILSDLKASEARVPMPSILLVAALDKTLNDCGMRLRASIVVESGEVKNTHHLAVLIGFGAAAVCPYLSLEIARSNNTALVGEELAKENVDRREQNFILAMEQGLLKIIAKMGVSVLQSYQGSGLFTILGFGQSLHDEFFPRHRSWLGGLSLNDLVNSLVGNPKGVLPSGFIHNYLFREHPKEESGEKHSMTLPRSKIVHQLVNAGVAALDSVELYDAYLKSGLENEPISIRHLLRPKISIEKKSERATALTTNATRADILKCFGSGAMSFGAISAEAQRDIILAMAEIGGRSNSGEGGENPFYYTEGVHAHTKQMGSGRFGVTAEYLVTSQEIQIKIAQGAKPGEGGQLMACKVGPETARARYSDENVDLISPPPMHDIYSIEDLKQLIYEVRQLKPHGRVSVKLVSGDNIGTIAVGVAKAGADIIHIAGHDGGTGAATLSSMKHAGLPWEIGLVDCHQALTKEKLRDKVTLRVDGGLATGRDIVTAALLGAEEFDFGKLLLVAEGCIMARICEKNTCPTGIATHDPRFKKRYKGSKDKIVSLLNFIADDVLRHLAQMQARSLAELVGRSDLLEFHPAHESLIKEKNLDLSFFQSSRPLVCDLNVPKINPFIDELSETNQRIAEDMAKASPEARSLYYTVGPRDRAVLATLNGQIAKERSQSRFQNEATDLAPLEKVLSQVSFYFKGSAGQGFAVFNQKGFELRLEGEANDSVAKSMSGGKVVIVPANESKLVASQNTIIGNCALYGATGGTLYVNGIAGDRFAIRNSGAVAVVEGVGVQACEYMTRGRVLILGTTGANLGAGMTGGILYLRRKESAQLNSTYVAMNECDENDLSELNALLQDYLLETGSQTATQILQSWNTLKNDFVKIVPKRSALKMAPEYLSIQETELLEGPTL